MPHIYLLPLWVEMEYGMKAKDETLNMSKRWFPEIDEVQERYPLLTVVRDNSGGNTAKGSNDFFINNGDIMELETIAARRTSNCRIAWPIHLWHR
jgi:hypothetical protein